MVTITKHLRLRYYFTNSLSGSEMQFELPVLAARLTVPSLQIETPGKQQVPSIMSASVAHAAAIRDPISPEKRDFRKMKD
jgi:hypothetical protein